MKGKQSPSFVSSEMSWQGWLKQGVLAPPNSQSEFMNLLKAILLAMDNIAAFSNIFYCTVV